MKGQERHLESGQAAWAKSVIESEPIPNLRFSGNLSPDHRLDPPTPIFSGVSLTWFLKPKIQQKTVLMMAPKLNFHMKTYH